MHKSNTLKLREYIAQFRRIGFQEFTACRNIEKQILNGKVTAFGARNRLLTFYLRTGDNQLCTQFFILKTGFKLHLRNGRNRSKRLTTEPHCT